MTSRPMLLPIRNNWAYFLFFSLLFFPVFIQAETFAEKTLSLKNELILPQRLTVGPNDNFQTAVVPDGSEIFYSSNTSLAVRIFRQKLNTQYASSLVGDRTDSKDPALSPDGGTLAFTSFQKDARGDICLFDLSTSSTRCITSKDSEDRSPFWLDSKRIGFLSRTRIEEAFSVGVQNIDAPMASPKILFSGPIADPTFSPTIQGSRYIAYTWIESDRSLIEIRKIDAGNLEVGSPIRFEVDLPGFSSFPSFDPSGEFLYFGQYTTDTNDDLIIDARDRSAIYRVKVSALLSQSEDLFPEPMTSIEYNCNYPIAAATGLFVTCAAGSAIGEGSLDIYRLPLTGMIPEHWDRTYLNRAIETARSYSDRILLEYALQYKYRNSRKEKCLQKILSNYVNDHQLSAALFYARKLASSKFEPDFYKLLSILLESELRAEKEGENRRSSDFRSWISQQEKKAAEIRYAKSEWKKIVLIRLKTLTGSASSADLQGISASAIQDPLALFYYGEILDALTPKNRSQNSKNLSNSRILNEMSQVYYAYRFLQQTDEVYESEAKRIDFLKSIKAGLSKKDSALGFLIENEMIGSRIKTDAPENQNDQKLLAIILKRTLEVQNHYPLYRAAFTRGILYFGKRSLWNHMYSLATGWLNHASSDDSEYSYIRKIFLSLGLEKGYGSFVNGSPTAGGQFMITARLTNDLEAHHGFIRSWLKANRRGDLQTAYQNMQRDKMIEENIKYVNVLFSLIDWKAKGSSQIDLGLFKSNLSALESMSKDIYNPGPRLLMMGFLAQNLYADSIKKGESDVGYFLKAHRYSMLALDLSRGNERVVGPLLMNLGILHQLVGNHGQSLSFFELRKEHLFEDPEERSAFAFYYSKSLFLNSRSDEAVAVISSYLKEKNAIKNHPEFLEKAAFYSAQAKDYSSAVRYYSEFMKTKPSLNVADEVRILTGNAYALFKAKKYTDSKNLFEKLMKAKAFPKPNDASVSLPLSHYQIIALGYLSQMENEPLKKVKLLEQRLSALESIGGDLNAQFIKKEDWLKDKITVRHQIAAAAFKAKDSKRVKSELGKSIDEIAELNEQTSNPLERASVLGLSNYFAMAGKSSGDDFPKRSKAETLAAKVNEALAKAPELQKVSEYAAFKRSTMRNR